MKAETQRRARIRFDLPDEYIRALRVRAVLEDVYPRDILILALEQYLADDLQAHGLFKTRRAGVRSNSNE